MASITRKVSGLAVVVMLAGFSSMTMADEKPAAKAEPTTINIGMPKTLFQGIPKFLIDAGAEPFKRMMKNQTGLDGVLHYPADAKEMADLIDAGKIDIGVMYGYDLGETMQKHSHLTPIAVAVPLEPAQAFLVVKWDCKAKNIADLKDQKISVPPVHRYFCERFLAKQKEAHMKGASFAGQLSSASSSDSIKDVIEDRAGVAIVDAATINWFQAVEPGQFKNVKILEQSEVFPSTCIVVKKDQLTPKTIASFSKALINAPNDPTGKHMLVTWKLKGFISVPDEYPAQVKAIMEKYPSNFGKIVEPK